MHSVFKMTNCFIYNDECFVANDEFNANPVQALHAEVVLRAVAICSRNVELPIEYAEMMENCP